MGLGFVFPLRSWCSNRLADDGVRYQNICGKRIHFQTVQGQSLPGMFRGHCGWTGNSKWKRGRGQREASLSAAFIVCHQPSLEHYDPSFFHSTSLVRRNSQLRVKGMEEYFLHTYHIYPLALLALKSSTLQRQGNL